MPHGPASLADVDLTDLDRFARGFPHDIFARLRREAPVWWHPPTPRTPGGEGFWVVSRHADVVAAAGDPATFSSESGGARDGGGTLLEDLPRGIGPGMLLNMLDDPRHRSIRRVLTPGLSARALARLGAVLRARAVALVDAFVDAGGGDLVHAVAAALPLLATTLLLGIPDDARATVVAWEQATLDYGDRQLGETTARTQEAQAAMTALGFALVAARRETPGDDLLSLAIAAAPDGAPLPDHACVMLFHLLAAAGTATTRNALALGVLALAERPDAWARLRADAAVLPAAVEEILRWASSTPYNRRTATRDVVLGDAAIRAGDKVSLWWASANRDEGVFADPFTFDVGRTPNPHLAFGHGTHFCLGAQLARLEIRLALERLRARAATLTLAGAPECTRSNKHTGLRRLPLAVRPA
jgi:cytochrome P450